MPFVLTSSRSIRIQVQGWIQQRRPFLLSAPLSDARTGVADASKSDFIVAAALRSRECLGNLIWTRTSAVNRWGAGNSRDDRPGPCGQKVDHGIRDKTGLCDWNRPAFQFFALFCRASRNRPSIGIRSDLAFNGSLFRWKF